MAAGGEGRGAPAGQSRRTQPGRAPAPAPAGGGCACDDVCTTVPHPVPEDEGKLKSKMQKKRLRVAKHTAETCRGPVAPGQAHPAPRRQGLPKSRGEPHAGPRASWRPKGRGKQAQVEELQPPRRKILLSVPSFCCCWCKILFREVTSRRIIPPRVGGTGQRVRQTHS